MGRKIASHIAHRTSHIAHRTSHIAHRQARTRTRPFVHALAYLSVKQRLTDSRLDSVRHPCVSTPPRRTTSYLASIPDLVRSPFLAYRRLREGLRPTWPPPVRSKAGAVAQRGLAHHVSLLLRMKSSPLLECFPGLIRELSVVAQVGLIPGSSTRLHYMPFGEARPVVSIRAARTIY